MTSKVIFAIIHIDAKHLIMSLINSVKMGDNLLRYGGNPVVNPTDRFD